MNAVLPTMQEILPLSLYLQTRLSPAATLIYEQQSGRHSLRKSGIQPSSPRVPCESAFVHPGKSGIEPSSSQAPCESALAHPGYRLLIRHDLPLSPRLDHATGCLRPECLCSKSSDEMARKLRLRTDESGLRRGINGGLCLISECGLRIGKEKGRWNEIINFEY
ncbi:hypothetical protein CEXT_91931 [Caerostris extrusa]|uniref:Uncharacterized protein n=1 Tax=Caerostris extrusa TaxID=172846 RepID=A0AAV4XC72_CAEEX|nr:hypothetical protein CEXT_91931 [Caerostris extrusa]